MKLILENWQKFVNEEIIEEAPNDSVRRWFSASLKKIADPAKKLEEAEKLLKIAQEAVKSKNISKIAPKVAQSANQDIINQYLQGIEQLLKSQAPDGNPQSMANKLRAAAADAEAKEKLKLAATAAKEQAEENNVESPEAQAKIASSSLEVAGLGDASKNKEIVNQVVDAMGGEPEDPDKDADAEAAPPEQADAEIADPSDPVLTSLVDKYDIFINDFYDKTKVDGLRGQAKIVNALLKALADLSKEEDKEASLGRASTQKPAQTTPEAGDQQAAAASPEAVPGKRDDLYEAPEEETPPEEAETDREEEAGDEAPPPKDLKNFKASVRSFKRNLRASKELVKKAQNLTQQGKISAKGFRDKLVKFAKVTQQSIISLNNSLNSILTPAGKATLQEASAGEEFMKKLEAIEAVHDALAGTDTNEGGLANIINKLKSKATGLGWPEIKPAVKNALEKLNTIRKYFPSIIPFEGGKVEAGML